MRARQGNQHTYVVVFNHSVQVQAIRRTVNCSGQRFLLSNACILLTACQLPCCNQESRTWKQLAVAKCSCYTHTACFTCNIWCLHNLPQHVDSLHQRPSANAQQEGAAQRIKVGRFLGICLLLLRDYPHTQGRKVVVARISARLLTAVITRNQSRICCPCMYAFATTIAASMAR